MRDVAYWKRSLVKQLKLHWDNADPTPPIDRAVFANVELGLHLHLSLIPDEPAERTWTLLTGYLPPADDLKKWTKAQWQQLHAARHLLRFQRQHTWESLLTKYWSIDARLRGFGLDSAGRVVRRDVSVAAGRFEIYERTLAANPRFRKTNVRWATPGEYWFRVRGHPTRLTVNLPDDLCDPGDIAGHSLAGVPRREPIHVSWGDLINTAGEMDLQLSTLADRDSDASNHRTGRFEQTLRQSQLDLVTEDASTLRPADELTFSGAHHWVGMVSAGKTTLMQVLAVWCARHGYRITLVVGDIIGALRLAETFEQLGITVAPMLGQSDRARHIERLHNSLNAVRPGRLVQWHPAFRWLSNVCLLDGLRDRDGSTKPLPFGDMPCQSLHKPDSDEQDETPERLNDHPEEEPTYYCPLFAHCPVHRAQRDLVNAQIWIATPAALVYTRVAAQINREQVRFGELVNRCSDLVVVDEADWVQAQIDGIFSPSQNLTGSEKSWLDYWKREVSPQLTSGLGRGRLREADADEWNLKHNTLQTAVDRVHFLVQSQPPIRDGQYFTQLYLLKQLALLLSGGNPDSPEYRFLEEQMFSPFRDDPFGEHTRTDLSDLAMSMLSIAGDALHVRTREWLAKHSPATFWQNADEGAKKRAVELLEFAVATTILTNRIDDVLHDWQSIEHSLDLEGTGKRQLGALPEDFIPFMPTSPMGNVLALQFVPTHGHHSNERTLRFFHCGGIGRWLLLHFHELMAADGIAGPHVLLMSGSSWSGPSRYDLLVPVTGVMRPSADQIAGIEQSTFRFEWLSDPETHLPIQVSGKEGDDRLRALGTILYQLVRGGGLDGTGPSRLELDAQALPPHRRKIALIVGSYAEADAVTRKLYELRPDWKKDEVVVPVAPDDDPLDGSPLPWIRRGMLYRFRDRTTSWILVTPLMAFERGHNILNEDDVAALGAVYFLIRPHQRPDDISPIIAGINRWGLEHGDDKWLAQQDTLVHGRVAEAVVRFRQEAFAEWRRRLNRPVSFSHIPPTSPEHAEAVWNQLVPMWQVIGRAVRGGQSARVYFVDAAFAPRTARNEIPADDIQSSLLLAMRAQLRSYFDPNSRRPARDRALAEALYRPLYLALKNIGGLPHDKDEI